MVVWLVTTEWLCVCVTVAGETSNIQLEVVQPQSTFAIIKWSNFHTADSREILSWVVNYREV